MKIIIFIISFLLSVVLLAVYETSILVIAEFTSLSQKQAGMFLLLGFFSYFMYDTIIEEVFGDNKRN